MRPAALLTALCLSARLCASTQDPALERSYRYFKTPEPLRLDPSAFAVLPAPGVDGARVHAALRRRDVREDDVRPFEGGSWFVVATPAAGRTPRNYERFLRRVAEDRSFAFVSPQWIDRYGGGVFARPTLYVGFPPTATAAESGTVLALERAGTILARDAYGVPGAFALKPPTRDGAELLALANRLAARKEVRFAEPEFVTFGRPQHVPDDPEFRRCWGLGAASGPPPRAAVDGVTAWNLTRGSPDVPVLVMDCGVERDHPDLRVDDGVDATDGRLSGDGSPGTAFDGHGTSVAGVVAARMDNALGGCGLAPECRLLSARVYRSVPRRRYVAETGAIARALAWGRSRGARVSNFSAYLSLPSALVAAAYERSRELGVVHFAAAGNYNTDDLAFPAALPFVRSVVALTKEGHLAPFSNFGGRVDFAAPGVDVFTADLRGMAGAGPGDFAAVHGTSFASPFAAGAAALVLSIDPSLSAHAVEDVLARAATDLGDRGRDGAFGFGAIHAGRAVRLAAEAERPTDPLTRASAAASGLQGDSPSYDAAVSANGRWIAFTSEAATFGPAGGIAPADVYVRPVHGGAPVRVGLDEDGRTPGGACREPALSADGRFVAFTSYAAFSAVDRNGVRDVYVRDRDADENGVFDEPGLGRVRLELVSRVPGGGAGDGPSHAPSISADGAFVAFESAAPMFSSDRNGRLDVYVARRTPEGWRTVGRASAREGGADAAGDARRPVLAADGRTVVFESGDDALAPGDGNDRYDAFVVALDAEGVPTGAPRRASSRADGRAGDAESRRPVVSADGRVVAFATLASDLEPSLRAPGVVRLAVSVDGGPPRYVAAPDDPPAPTARPEMAAAAKGSADGVERATPALLERLALDAAGSRLWFSGAALRSGQGGRDLFVVDLTGDGLARAAVPTLLGGGRAGAPAVDAAGAALVFDSDAPDLVRGDTNGRRDVFLLRR
jgi:subtilisin family serine protease